MDLSIVWLAKKELHLYASTFPQVSPSDDICVVWDMMVFAISVVLQAVSDITNSAVALQEAWLYILFVLYHPPPTLDA